MIGLARILLGVRPVLEGALPKGPVLFAAKHESAYETLLLLALIDDPVIVLKREIADVPLFGRLTRRHAAGSVRRLCHVRSFAGGGNADDAGDRDPAPARRKLAVV